MNLKNVINIKNFYNQKKKHPQDRAKEQGLLMTQQRDDVIKLRATITSLDREKDALQGKLDDKIEKLHKIEDDLIVRQEENKELKNNNSQLGVICFDLIFLIINFVLFSLN